jgi:hypothetical protein
MKQTGWRYWLLAGWRRRTTFLFRFSRHPALAWLVWVILPGTLPHARHCFSRKNSLPGPGVKVALLVPAAVMIV